MDLIKMQVEDYLKLVASDAPAPGGGSASALCGAQGVGLISMVANLTLGKKKYEAYHALCAEIAEEAALICGKLTKQVDIDTEAYGRIANAFKLPKETDEEKAARRKAINEATVYAAQVPLETMRLAVEGLECAKKLIGNYNTNCASDVGCGVYGLLSCVKGAWLNVMINVSGLGDEGEALYGEGEGLLEKAEILASETEAAVKTDIAG